MDTQFHQNNLNGNNSGYSSLPGISPHQLQQSSNLPPHTLPPLQASQHATIQQQPMYGGNPHTPRTPATPQTPASANTLSFPHMSQASRYQLMNNNQQQQQQQQQQHQHHQQHQHQQQQHQQQQQQQHHQQQQQQHQQQQPHQQQQQSRSFQLMSANNNNEQGYRAITAVVPQSSNASSMSYPQAIAPAPAQNRLPQALRPMPPNGMHMQGGMHSPYGQNNLMGHLSELEPPTHVVGSQGRRGILPSAPGRPPVSASTGKGAMIPAKDADGKFPCPHCTKTYLHAKHLKRHLLRHTGDRPYMCILCRDTFSRSDILKRHFQKCSIRRGNPTGASHLSHSQAHLKKSHPSSHKAVMPSDSSMIDINGMGHPSGGMQIFGVVPDGSVSNANSNLTGDQAEHLHSSNLKRIGAPSANDVRSMNGPGPGVSNRVSFGQNYPGVPTSTMPSGMNPSFAFSVSQGQNGHSYNQAYDYASQGTAF